MIPNGSGPKPAESRAARTVREVFESGRPLIYIRSSEEQRVASILQEVAADQGLPLLTWRLTDALRGVDGQPIDGTETPRGVLDFIAEAGQGIFHLKDFHEPLRDSAEIRRRLRDTYDACLGRQKFVVITSAVRFVPEEVERSILFLELRTPD
ncbi:MAG TPA: AAA family ATPase, partial [Bryobacteraceae bacterium]|nr:AAA family ATPase [Bryobacteraceae bacterium]